MILSWLRSHSSYLVLACLSVSSCGVFALIAQLAGLVERYSARMLVASALAVAYLLPILVPFFRKLIWSTPRSLAKGLAMAIWWTLPLIVIISFAMYSRFMGEVYSKNVVPDVQHRRWDELASIHGIVLGEPARRLTYQQYVYSGHEPLKPHEAEWGWRRFLEFTRHPIKTDDDRAQYALLRLGRACEEQRKFHQSEEVFRQYLAVTDFGSKQAPDSVPNAGSSMLDDRRTALRGVSTSLAHRGEYRQAADFLKQALDISKHQKRERQIMEDSAELADLYVQLENYEAAEPLAAAVLNWSGQLASQGLKSSSGHERGASFENYAKACLRLSKILGATGRSELAEKYGRMVKIFRDNSYPSPKPGS